VVPPSARLVRRSHAEAGRGRAVNGRRASRWASPAATTHRTKSSPTSDRHCLAAPAERVLPPHVSKPNLRHSARADGGARLTRDALLASYETASSRPTRGARAGCERQVAGGGESTATRLDCGTTQPDLVRGSNVGEPNRRHSERAAGGTRPTKNKKQKADVSGPNLSHSERADGGARHNRKNSKQLLMCGTDACNFMATGGPRPERAVRHPAAGERPEALRRRVELQRAET